MEGLASGFGMGPGGPPPPWPLTAPGGARRLLRAIARATLRAAQRRIRDGKREADRACEDGTRARPISNARLSASPRLQLRPINLVVYEGPYRKGNSSWGRLPA